MDFRIIIYIIFGILPSLIWLSIYMREDVHPEPKKMILKIFLWGALITLPVIVVQLGLKEILNIISLKFGLPNLDSLLLLPFSHLNSPELVIILIHWFLVISLSEEFLKYLIIRIKVLNSPDLDEPLDIMLYMIIAALGFAALENILYLFAPGPMSFNDLMTRTLSITLLRFAGATFLHTLCSAVVGYSLAISLCQVKRKYISVASGIFMAVLLHGLYDFFIMTLDGYLKLAIPAVIIITLAFLVFSGFENLKKMKSVCKLN